VRSRGKNSTAIKSDPRSHGGSAWRLAASAGRPRCRGRRGDDARRNYQLRAPLTADRIFAGTRHSSPRVESASENHRRQLRDDSGGRCRLSRGRSVGRGFTMKRRPRARPGRYGSLPKLVRGTRQNRPALIAGLAHVWFVTIHPFDDGNGRIARAIADMALAHSEQSTQRFYSMSAQIRASGATITRRSNAPRRVPSMLRRGRNGSFPACSARSRVRKTLWARC